MASEEKKPFKEVVQVVFNNQHKKLFQDLSKAASGMSLNNSAFTRMALKSYLENMNKGN